MDRSNLTVQAQRFVEGVLPDALHGCALLWSGRTKKSTWLRGLDAIVDKAVEQDDLYIGVAFAPAGLRAGERCAADKTLAIYALWMDVDVAAPGIHDKPLPANIDEAIALASCITKPTAIVCTGYGVQAWWAFKETWVFSDDTDRRKAQALIEGWQAAHRRKAKERGWEFDSTFDLARVMRMPGTFNAKREPKIPVVIDERSTWTRYDPSDFADYALTEPGAAPKIKNGDALIINPECGPPWSKWAALRTNDPRVNTTFERTRKDLGDTSPSGYDMALASFAAGAGWSPQEITDLLVASRVQHKDDLKRPEYYERTIAKARSTVAQINAQETIDSIIEIGPKEGEDVLGSLSVLLFGDGVDVKITRVVKFTTDPPRYRIETTKGAIQIPSVAGLIEQLQFKHILAAATGILMIGKKKEDWHNIAQALLKACIEIDAGPESTDGGQLAAWIAAYMEDTKPMPEAEHENAIGLNRPFI